MTKTTIDVFSQWYALTKSLPVGGIGLSDQQKAWALNIYGYGYLRGNSEQVLTLEFDRLFSELYIDDSNGPIDCDDQEEYLFSYAFAENLSRPPSANIHLLYVVALRIFRILSYFSFDDMKNVITCNYDEPVADQYADNFLTWVGETIDLVNGAIQDACADAVDDERKQNVVAVVDITMQLMASLDDLKARSKEKSITTSIEKRPLFDMNLLEKQKNMLLSCIAMVEISGLL
jgi:hypothetical protein